MLNITTLVVGQLAANCFIINDTHTKECIIVDPGDDSEYIIQKIMDQNLTPTSIVATHAHFDHIGGVLPLSLAFSIPFLMHEKDTILLKHFRQSSIRFTKNDPGPAPQPSAFLKDGDVIHIGTHKILIKSAPGHTPGTINLYLQDTHAIFVGDNLFSYGSIGRTDFKYCNKVQLIESIRHTFSLPSTTIVYPGHGESFLLEEIKPYFFNK